MGSALPDWLPWWVPLVLLLPALLYCLAFLFMPFSVIGIKSRLEAIEARLDDIQQDIKALGIGVPDTDRPEETYHESYVAPTVNEPRTAPPIPPPVHSMVDEEDDRPPPPPHLRPVRIGEREAERAPMRAEPRIEPRTEPRLNWPR